jgi:hypothetical protein
MPKPYDNPDFRYPNDNRLSNVETYNYPSQGEVNETSSIGEKGFYPNDNSGYYGNSNRLNISVVDTVDKEQPPNSNYKIP